MGPFLFFYVALAGFLAAAAVLHFVLWCSSRREYLLAVFSADCAVRVGVSAALVAVARSETINQAHFGLWARVALGIVAMTTSLWCLSLVSGVRARWFVRGVTTCYALFFVVHVLIRPLNADVLAIDPLVLPWGETISNPRLGPAGWWFGPVYALAAASQVFGIYCGTRLWRRDRVAGALVIAACCGMLAVFGLDVLRAAGVRTIPVVGVVPQAFWVVAFAVLIARGHGRIRRELAASERRFRGIFDQTFQFIGLMKTDGTLLEANRTALEFAGIREADVIGRPFWETPWWSHSPELQARLREAIGAATAGQTVRFEATHPRPGGRIAHVDFSLKPVRDEEGRVTLLIPEARDITELKEAEEGRRALETQLFQREKMAAIGQMAGGVAHDFNNLLTVINGNSELMLLRAAPGDGRAEMLRSIHDAGRLASSLTAQLLTVSRQQVIERKAVNLNGVIGGIDGLLRRLVGENVRLELALTPDLAPIRADTSQLGQVVMNLVVNARDAMPEGGTVRVATATVTVDASQIAMHAGCSPGPYVALTVADTGWGMSPEVRARIFEPFYTTKGPGKGTGLGLATVSAIVDECGGFLEVETEPGKGSRFRLFFPALSRSAQAEAPAAKDDRIVQGAETILLVEDDPAVRALTRQVLERLGYAVIDAPGGAEALELVERRKGPIDLLVTDVVMPGIGGRELAARLGTMLPGLRILFLSGFSRNAAEVHWTLEGNAFLQKPFTLEAISAKVREALDTETSSRVG